MHFLLLSNFFFVFEIITEKERRRSKKHMFLVLFCFCNKSRKIVLYLRKLFEIRGCQANASQKLFFYCFLLFLYNFIVLFHNCNIFLLSLFFNCVFSNNFWHFSHLCCIAGNKCLCL